MKLKAYDVILSPVITEKSTLVSEANQVIFKVAPKATKTDIKAAVETSVDFSVITGDRITSYALSFMT